MNEQKSDMGMKHEGCKCDQEGCAHCSGKGKCNCPHHMIIPAMIILIGVVALLGAFNILTSMWVSVLWPIFVIVIGVTKIKSRSCKCC